MSYVGIRAPQLEELNDCQNVTMAAEFEEWEPYYPLFMEKSKYMKNHEESKTISSLTTFKKKYDVIPDKCKREKNITNSMTTAKKNLLLMKSPQQEGGHLGITSAHETKKATTQKTSLKLNTCN